MPTKKRRLRCDNCTSRIIVDKMVFVSLHRLSGTRKNFGFCGHCSGTLDFNRGWTPPKFNNWIKPPVYYV